MCAVSGVQFPWLGKRTLMVSRQLCAISIFSTPISGSFFGLLLFHFIYLIHWFTPSVLSLPPSVPSLSC